MLWKWLFKRIKKKLNLGTAIIAVSSFVFLTILIIIFVSMFIFGFDDSQWTFSESEKVIVDKVGPVKSNINLGDVQYVSKDPTWGGELFTGYNDPLQKAMAKEILEMYGRVSEKQETLMKKGVDKDKLIEVLLGIHLAEVDTYSWKTYRKVDSLDPGDVDKPKQTYIPLGFVKWSDYEKVTTASGKSMNFTNYNWSDFKARYDIENPSNGYLGTKEGNTTYEHGLNYHVLRSPSGAIGPFQFQPETWKKDTRYLTGGDYSYSNPVQIMDIESYATSDIDGRAVDFNEDNYEDIFNQGDLALAALNWYSELFDVSSSDPTKTSRGVGITDGDMIQVHFGYSYFGGSGLDSTNRHIFNKDIKEIISNDEIYQKFKQIYKSSYGHGGEVDLIYQLYEQKGWVKTGSGGVTKTVDGITATLTKNGTIYPLRVYFQGKAWYEFLRGIAYGGQQSPPSVSSGGLNKVRYNYMTESDSKRKIDMTTRTKALDSKMAIGYKGNIPIYDQNGQYMKQFRMLYPPDDGGEWTFYRGACTVFTMTSMYYATGDYILPINHLTVDLDRNNLIDPVEFWGQGRQYAGNGIKSMNPKDFSSKQWISTVTIREILRGVGYTVANTAQGTAESNAEVLEKLKQRIPVHIRIASNRQVSALVPKQNASEISYLEFDMYDINNYKEGSVALASIGHSVLGVEAKEFNGEWYVSIVNSTGHHNSGVDTNLSWFKASSILADRYTNGYTIVGSTVDSSWKPYYLGGSFTVVEEDTSRYEGVYYSQFLDNLDSASYYYQDFQTIRVEPSDTSLTTVRVKGRYETKAVGSDKMYVYLGQTGGLQSALEITNIRNPKTNNVGDISGNEYTELYGVQYGDVAIVRLGTFDDSGEFIYESFYDESE